MPARARPGSWSPGRPPGQSGSGRWKGAAGLGCLLAGIRHAGAQRREVNKKLATAVKASGTSLTEVFGAGPVIAATVIGDVVTAVTVDRLREVSRPVCISCGLLLCTGEQCGRVWSGIWQQAGNPGGTRGYEEVRDDGQGRHPAHLQPGGARSAPGMSCSAMIWAG